MIWTDAKYTTCQDALAEAGWLSWSDGSWEHKIAYSDTWKRFAHSRLEHNGEWTTYRAYHSVEANHILSGAARLWLEDRGVYVVPMGDDSNYQALSISAGKRMPGLVHDGYTKTQLEAMLAVLEAPQ